ncbi:MAG: Rpn family recombination-promoting nuclease/putative transposase [Tannerella sp.]|jgi:predicted transposase/invertase (TIGR01784 family)|nr:Rpn family recombination-promoting nuclease/putative transposase [Tannerella sp.]
MAKKSKKNNGNKCKFSEGPGVFINPRTDFGFKRVFNNASMMKSFLNSVIMVERPGYSVREVTFLPAEHFGETRMEHIVITDTRCRIETGEDILVEMQNAQPKNFVERLLFYSTYLIRSQAPKRRRKGEDREKEKPWNYDLKAVYAVAIVNYPMIKSVAAKGMVIDRIKLMHEDTGEVFSDKLNFVIVDLTKFDKKEEELETQEDFWLYSLKHAETLAKCPDRMKEDEAIRELYDILRTNKLTPEEMKAYYDNVISMEKISLFTDHAKEEGIEIGKEEGIEIGEERGIEIATVRFVINAAGRGIPAEEIAGITELTVGQVQTILRNKKTGEA